MNQFTVEIADYQAFHEIHALEWTETIIGHHHFRLEIQPGQLNLSALSGGARLVGLVGKRIGIKTEVEYRADGNTISRTFNGIITRAGSQGGTDDRIVLEGKSDSVSLDGTPRTRSFLNGDLGGIFREVTAAYGDAIYPRDDNDGTDETIPYLVQYRETDWAFLRRLAARFGKSVYADGLSVVLGTLTNAGTVALESQHVRDVSIFLEAKPGGSDGSGYNYQKNEWYVVEAKSRILSGVAADLQTANKRVYPINGHQNAVVFPSSEWSIGNREAKVVATRLGQSYGFTAITRKPDLQLLNVVKLNRKEDARGYFRIKEICHYFNRNNSYYNEVSGTETAVAAAALFPPSTPSVCPPATAQVIANDDPDGQHRVQVRFAWQREGEHTDWIPTNTIGAGPERGFNWLPEVDDIVMVGFEAGNPDRPFVSGNYFHYGAKPTYQDRDNARKSIRTRSGNELYFSDKAGEETIRILNPDEKNEITLTLANGGGITIKTEGKMSFQANEINLEANKITLSADNEMCLEAKDISQNAEGKIVLKGTETLLSANTSATLTSDGKLDLKGGTLATMQAPLIKLN